MGGVLSEREKEVRQIVRTLARASSVGVEFGPGQRASDVTLVWLRGQKQQVLALPLTILEALPSEDLEVLGGSGNVRAYTLKLVVTDRLESQVVSDNERRAKLLHFLRRESV